jgi:uncharacterized membrane protein
VLRGRQHLVELEGAAIGAAMTAIAHTHRRRLVRTRPVLQPIFLAGALAILVPISVALPVTLLRGRPLPWQLHMPWVSPHLAVALMVLALGAMQLALPKGDRRHRLIGYAWCALMAFISLSGLLIQLEPGHLTIIHMASSVFAVVNLVLLPLVIAGARTGRRRLHRIAALGMFACLLNAGALAFIPFRAVGALVFGAFH